MSKVLLARVSHFDQYLQKLGNKMDKSCIQYWKRYGMVCPDGPIEEASRNAENKDSSSLYVFPGRTRCRTGIVFERNDKQECTKNYFKGTSKVPSFMTVQCSCVHPKLLGFVLLRECESISAALSSVLTHFRIPPRRVWYDNACNTVDCAVSRIPWLLRWTTFMVDRFHYTGHNCSNIFNGSMHPTLDDDRSVAAEVLNAVLNKGVSHIAYLKGINVIPFMQVLFAYVNATWQVRDTMKRDDLEDEEVMDMFRSMFRCTCHLCGDRETMDMEQSGSAASVTHFFRSGVTIFNRQNEQVPLPDD